MCDLVAVYVATLQRIAGRPQGLFCARFMISSLQLWPIRRRVGLDPWVEPCESKNVILDR